ncbi:MAG: DUF4167 domain-containing protein [Novosphingobium sp.]|nr:DUF4167 domain-containing protein [Novosphingobium sp.]MBX9643043.1 DUF4167 domain-containing protein [Novosphingobium sp.]
MNNNRGNNNNRRRGRGNRPNNGGGQQVNRIDSRARGNAPQLLEKYRKLAHDAHLNGDRVQAEYYLQFADHYFRVLADARTRQEEQRRPRDERWEGGNEESDESEEFSGGNSDFPSFEQPQFTRPQRDQRPQRDERDERDEDSAREDDEGEREAAQAQDERDDSQPNPYEPTANPFVREGRTRGLRPRRERVLRHAQDDRTGGREDEADAAFPGLDPSSLPPAISASRDDGDAEEAPKPRRGRPAKRKPSADEAGGEALESVG